MEFLKKTAFFFILVCIGIYFPYFLIILLIFYLLNNTSTKNFEYDIKTNNVTFDGIIMNKKIVEGGLYKVVALGDNKQLEIYTIENILTNRTLIIGLPDKPKDFGFSKISVQIKRGTTVKNFTFNENDNINFFNKNKELFYLNSLSDED